MNLLKWNLYTQQQTIAESIPMQEVHIVLLYDRELQSAAEHIAVFKSGLQPEEELLLYRTELRPQTKAHHAVLVPCQTVFVNHTSIPEISFPEIVTYRLLPVIPDLTIYFDRISV